MDRPNGTLVRNTGVVHNIVSYGAMQKCTTHFASVSSYTTKGQLNRVSIAQKAPGCTTLDGGVLQSMEELCGIPVASVAHEEFELRLPIRTST